MKMGPALDMRNVSYAVDRKKILDSIDWTVQQENTGSFWGPMAQGKPRSSRLLAVISGPMTAVKSTGMVKF
jgi:ABC-type molybdenum transport system ATPase subunit/photorepair protein PhrA